ncbi:MAG TPA: S8 family serine peptidase [Pirellulaceae bacterium]
MQRIETFVMAERPTVRVFTDFVLQPEALEPRCCFSTFAAVAAVCEFADDLSPRAQGQRVPGPGSSAGSSADVIFARERLGLHGLGQTVAIIDTGIAYDHTALGGGWGTSYRVVGGWDFAENDANPYDDAPGGLHGTHVAGIVGSDDPHHPGIAPQVDLVALRVFDDAGRSSFAQVEQALRWVHQHRDRFENPITTVNMSLGADWNSPVIPNWATLEDELAQLQSDGILVTVSAGNDFARLRTVGLSYPAVSPYVLPVGSTNAAGQLSEFSQRDPRMLAAVGEWVTSTAPDYLFGFNGITDDFLDLSGTSMAAPIVAGASVLVREALGHVGASDTSGLAVQRVLFESSTELFDAVTQTTYRRLNLRNALQSVLGRDEPGGAFAATSLGTLRGRLDYSGVLQTGDDTDQVRFRAEASGQVEVRIEWEGRGEQRPGLIGAVPGSNGAWTIAVKAGESYTLGVVGQGGVGRFTVALRAEAPAIRPLVAPIASHVESYGSWTPLVVGHQADRMSPVGGSFFTRSGGWGAGANSSGWSFTVATNWTGVSIGNSSNRMARATESDFQVNATNAPNPAEVMRSLELISGEREAQLERIERIVVAQRHTGESSRDRSLAYENELDQVLQSHAVSFVKDPPEELAASVNNLKQAKT